jgi:hypothetical protein
MSWSSTPAAAFDDRIEKAAPAALSESCRDRKRRRISRTHFERAPAANADPPTRDAAKGTHPNPSRSDHTQQRGRGSVHDASVGDTSPQRVVSAVET